MITRAQELCRQLKPVLGKKIDRLWSVYLAESDMKGKADIEQTLELLAAKHLGKTTSRTARRFRHPRRISPIAARSSWATCPMAARNCTRST